MKKPNKKIQFAFFGSSVDSTYALEQLERVDLSPALVISGKEVPIELYNTEWDFFLVCSYGKILKKEILNLPKHGCINIHPSLLPKFRGPSPYVSAILADERQTGVTVMLMEEKMDAGPILAQARIEIEKEEWPPKGLLLSRMLFTEGINLFAEFLPAWLKGELKPQAQNESMATYTKKFTDKDALIDISRFRLDKAAQRQAFLKIKAFDKNPRAYFLVNKKRVIITDAEYKNGELKILRVIPEGRKEMPYEDFKNGLASRGQNL